MSFREWRRENSGTRADYEASLCHDAVRQVEAVLDVLAPHPDLPPERGFTFAPGVEDLRVPRILFDYEGRAVRPSDEQLRALAEQIVTAIRTAGGAQ